MFWATLRKVALPASLVLSATGLAALIGYEGSVNKAYRDPVGVVTVCSGHTASAKLGQVKTNAECLGLLRQDTAEAEGAVKRLVTVAITQAQFDALVSFTFNVGSSNLSKSSLLRYLNAGSCWKAGAEFPKWVYAKGTKLPGLVARRNNERLVFETGCIKETP